MKTSKTRALCFVKRVRTEEVQYQPQPGGIWRTKRPYLVCALIATLGSAAAACTEISGALWMRVQAAVFLGLPVAVIAFPVMLVAWLILRDIVLSKRLQARESVWLGTPVILFTLGLLVCAWREWGPSNRFSNYVMDPIPQSVTHLRMSGCRTVDGNLWVFSFNVSPADADAIIRHNSMACAPWLFSKDDLKLARVFAGKLKHPPDEFSACIRGRLKELTRLGLAGWEYPGELPSALRESIVEDLNSIVLGPSLWNEAESAKVSISQEAEWLGMGNPSGRRLARFNRFVLEDAFPLDPPATAPRSVDRNAEHWKAQFLSRAGMPFAFDDSYLLYEKVVERSDYKLFFLNPAKTKGYFLLSSYHP